VCCILKRERLVRHGHGTWDGRVHEAQLVNGPAAVMDPNVVRWVHHKQPGAPDSNTRNLRILRAWVKDEPRNPRVLGYLGTEEAARGQHKRAVGYYKRYLALKTGWDEERAQIHRKLSLSLMALGKHQAAAETALAAFAVVPDWPDSHLSLAEACYALGEYEKAIKWCRDVLRLGQPDSLLILNPLDYVWKPRVVLAAALGALNRPDEALAVGREALQIVPDHVELRRHALGWESIVEREQVAVMYTGLAELLIRSDEQLKALALLEGAVPYFATDHPDVVACRSRVRERLLWVNDPAEYARHYREGGSKPEDMHVSDERALRVAERLPRAQFLARGIAEQIEEPTELAAAA
jgi:tetratricopeptide (TPR) repeat protein